MEEIWKDVVGYEGLYQVSNLGNVKGAEREIFNYRGKFIKKSLPIRQFIDRCGYCRVTLFKYGKPHSFTVHRLVATAFIPNPDKLKDVNHIDFNKQNNNVKNLEWCSRSYNVKHAIKHNPNILAGIRRTSKLARKPIIQYSLDGKFVKEYPSISQASKELGLSTSHICCVAKQKPEKGQIYIRKSSGGYIWRYKGDKL